MSGNKILKFYVQPSSRCDGSQDHLIPAGAVPLTEAEERALFNPPLNAEQLVERIRTAVQSHIDETARQRLYDNGNSLASYAASTNASWAAEAQAFVGWRDAVWAQVYALWADPPEPWPTPEGVIADLPVIS